MARTLAHLNLPFVLNYFSQSKAHLAFPELLESLGDKVKPLLNLSPEETGKQLESNLAGYAAGKHFYVCGPAPMLEAARAVAADAGWPDDAVHFEYFKNTVEVDDSLTFEVSLARTAKTLKVPAGKTILEVLRESGVEVESSCEQGVCGTCLCQVLEGEPDHQDM